MFLIHLLLSHQNVGFKGAFDVQLAFCFFMGERERKSRFSSYKLSSLGKAGDDPVPLNTGRIEEAPGRALL